MKNWFFFLGLFWILASCEPNRNSTSDIPVKQKFYKTDLQFISIAYTDVEGKAIPPEELSKLKELFLSQGDQTLNRLELVRYLIQQHQGAFAGENLRTKDPGAFIDFCFKKFYARYPNEQEKKELLKQFRHSAVAIEKWYFAFMSSKEYALL